MYKIGPELDTGGVEVRGTGFCPKPSRLDVRIQSWRTLLEVEVTGVGAAVAALDGRQE